MRWPFYKMTMSQKEIKNTENTSEEIASEVVDEKVETTEPEVIKKEVNRDEYNKKPFWTARIAGGLIDLCLLFLSVLGLNQLFLMTPIGAKLQYYTNEMVLIQDEYKLKTLVEGSDETYGHKVYENEDAYPTYKGYLVHDPDETEYCYIVVNNSTISTEVSNAYNKAIKADKTYNNYMFDYRLITYGVTMLSGFIAEAVFLLTIPLVNKRRATIGKFAAGTQVVDSKYQTPARWFQIVGRFAWQFIIESALIYLFLNSMILMVLITPVALFLITLLNKKGKTLHDFISRTMVIDKKTFLPINNQ